MLEELLSKNEGKTLEFKENTQSLQKIIQTIIAFANTAGGVLLLGIKNETKEIIGLANVLQEEEKIARRFLKKEGVEVKQKSADEEVQYRTFDEASSKAKQKTANRLKSRGFRGEVIAKFIF